MRYLGKKHNLAGCNKEEKIRVDLMENQSAQFRDDIVYLMHDKNFVSFLYLNSLLKLVFLCNKRKPPFKTNYS